METHARSQAIEVSHPGSGQPARGATQRCAPQGVGGALSRRQGQTDELIAFDCQRDCWPTPDARRFCRDLPAHVCRTLASPWWSTDNMRAASGSVCVCGRSLSGTGRASPSHKDRQRGHAAGHTALPANPPAGHAALNGRSPRRRPPGDG
jgi:hypothetical protein